MNGVDWTVMVASETGTYDTLKCKRCGATTKLYLPAKLADLPRFVDEFNARHADCQPAKDGTS